jgi:hypothetical protein
MSYKPGTQNSKPKQSPKLIITSNLKIKKLIWLVLPVWTYQKTKEEL